jgi:hypothetical protein
LYLWQKARLFFFIAWVSRGFWQLTSWAACRKLNLEPRSSNCWVVNHKPPYSPQASVGDGLGRP